MHRGLTAQRGMYSPAPDSPLRFVAQGLPTHSTSSGWILIHESCPASRLPPKTASSEIAVLYPTLSQKDEQQLLKEVEGFLRKLGSSGRQRSLGSPRSCVPCRESQGGKFCHLLLRPRTGKDPEIELVLKIEKNVLRHLIVKPPKGYQIVKFSELYEKWLKERETVDQVRIREKEEKLRSRS